MTLTGTSHACEAQYYKILRWLNQTHTRGKGNKVDLQRPLDNGGFWREIESNYTDLKLLGGSLLTFTFTSSDPETTLQHQAVEG